MSGWIKIRGSLLRSPKLIRMSSHLRDQSAFRRWISPCELTVLSDEATQLITLALLTVTWSSAREFGKGGEARNEAVTNRNETVTARNADEREQVSGGDLFLDGITIDEIDLMCGAPGFGKAMALVGWAKESKKPNGVILPNFMEWNTLADRSAAKSGAERARDFRQRKSALRNANRNETVTETVTESNAKVTESNGRVEKSREENTKTPLPPAGGKEKFDPSLAEMPEAINTQPVRESWAAWCCHRAEKKKPLTPTSVGRQLAQLAKFGPEKARDLLERAISGGYTGVVFPEDLAALAASKGQPSSQRNKELAETRRCLDEMNAQAEVGKELS